MAYVIDSKQVLLVTLIVLGALNAIFYLKNRRVDRRNVINTLFIMYFMIMLRQCSLLCHLCLQRLESLRIHSRFQLLVITQLLLTN